VSSLWTPGGERERPPTPEEEQLAADLAQMQQELASTPAAVIIANHAIGLFQLAAIHLDRDPANLEDARLAIDALSALVDGLPGRLGEEEQALKEALAQLRLAYVEVAKKQ
jgi:hypothetical protein